MLNIKYWDFSIWLSLVFTLVNLYFFFFAAAGLLSLVFGALFGYCFYYGVKR
jgi:hypothetical protein